MFSSVPSPHHRPWAAHQPLIPAALQGIGCICDIPRFSSVPGDVLHFSWGSCQRPGPFPCGATSRQRKTIISPWHVLYQHPQTLKTVPWCLQPSRGIPCHQDMATKPCMGSYTCPHVLPWIVCLPNLTATQSLGQKAWSGWRMPVLLRALDSSHRLACPHSCSTAYSERMGCSCMTCALKGCKDLTGAATEHRERQLEALM